MDTTLNATPPRLDRSDLDALFAVLARRGYRIVGPTVENGAIVIGELRASADLPIGWTDEQDGGTYRLRRRADDACFGFAAGPRSYKEIQLPPSQRLWQARRDATGAIEVLSRREEPVRHAFLGVRACDLHAIGILDRVVARGPHPDPAARALRDDAFVVAVQCGEAGGTCFCVSMGTGPRVEGGYDLSMTEVVDGDAHHFVVEIGSDAGADVAAELPLRAGTPDDAVAVEALPARAAGQMGRTMDAGDLRDLLQRNLEHPRWDDVADRCLSCGNCTMVCPTCFCTAVEDTTDLTGDVVERTQHWASCFTVDHAYVHGGSIRRSTRSRYRQWMTHKLSTWWDQFDTSGCVGCGRCITWCPVAIDITEEVAAIRATEVPRADDR